MNSKYYKFIAVICCSIFAIIFSIAYSLNDTTFLIAFFFLMYLFYNLYKFSFKNTVHKSKRVHLNINDRHWLNEHIDFYRKLTKEDKTLFEHRLGLFLGDVVITEVGKEVPEKEVCFYVASSAIITFWGLPYWNYGELSEVLVYPDNFDLENKISNTGRVQGKVHDGGLMDSTMILSLPALVSGFKNFKDGQNVGIHEFSHLIDKSNGVIDGLPDGFNSEMTKKWNRYVDIEFEKIEKGKSKLNSYALTNKGEFFAVLMEEFRENPVRLKKNNADLYEVINRWIDLNR